MSAPAAKTNGLPVSTSAGPVAAPRAAGSRRSSDSQRRRGRRTSACVILAVVDRHQRDATLRRVSTGELELGRPVSDVLPEQRGAHPHADAERRQPVAHVGPLTEAVRELRQQPDARRRQRMTAGDRAAVRVQPLVLGVDAEPVAPAQHLHGERLVQLEEADVVDRETGRARAPAPSRGSGRSPSAPARRRRTRSRRGASAARARARSRRPREASRADGRAVGQAGGVPGGHAAAGAERRGQRRRAPRASCPAAGTGRGRRPSSRRR